MKKIILVLAFVFTTNLIFTACKSENKEVKKEQITSDKKEEAVKDVYQCPMKCEKKNI
jgi:preprotein translocase subunit SecG